LGLFWSNALNEGGKPLFFPGRQFAGSQDEGAAAWIRGLPPAPTVRATWVLEDVTHIPQFSAGQPVVPHTAFADERLLAPLAYGEDGDQVLEWMVSAGRPDLRITNSPVGIWAQQMVIHRWEVGACYQFDTRIRLADGPNPEALVDRYTEWTGRQLPPLGPAVPSR